MKNVQVTDHEIKGNYEVRQRYKIGYCLLKWNKPIKWNIGGYKKS